MVKDEKLLPREQRESIQNLRNKIKAQFQGELEILHAQKFLVKLYDLQQKEISEEKKKAKGKKRNKIKPRKRPARVISETSPENTEIAIRVHDLRILDKDYDPLPVFLVRSTYGSETAMVYKRFDQFEELHSELKPKNLAAQLPTKADAFKEDTSDLLTQLTKYMLVILKEKRIAHSKTLRTFLGHATEKDAYSDVFDWAMKRISAFTHNIVYHDPVEGLTKYIVVEVCYEDDSVKRPDAKNKQEFLEFLRIVMKATAEDISEFWFQIQKDFEAVELSLNNFSDMKMLLDEYWGYIHTVQNAAKDSISEYLKEFHVTTNVVLKEMLPCFKYLYGHFEGLLEVCHSLQQELVDPNCAVISDDVETELYDMKRIIKDCPPSLYEQMGEIAGHISPPFTKLRLFFTCFDHIIEGMTGFFQVRNIVTVLNEMMARKVGMVKDEDISKKRIDTMEDELYIFLWRFERDGKFDVWRCFYEIDKKITAEYQALSPDEKIQLKDYFYTLTNMIVSISDHCLLMTDILHRGLKKFWWKAMDYLSFKTLNKRKKEINIPEVIKESFEFGVQKMVKHLRKNLMSCMTDCIAEIFAKAVREEIMDQCQARQTHVEISEQYIKIMPFEVIVLNAYLHMLKDEIYNCVFKWIHFFVMKNVKVVRRKEKEDVAVVDEEVVIKKKKIEEPKKGESQEEMNQANNKEKSRISLEPNISDVDMIIKDDKEEKNENNLEGEKESAKKEDNTEEEEKKSIKSKTSKTEVINDEDLTFECELSNEENTNEEQEEEEEEEDDSEEEEDESDVVEEKKEKKPESEEKKPIQSKEAYGFSDISSKLNFSDVINELNLDLTETTEYSSSSDDLELL
ncbi:hypothetical protein EHI8A_002200 [Entamoeba histolytica HM-1:IMSS-B]|uniref:PX domain-containing protein n=6 Tax=Entamoeba histolytica TaxID=5759 RepID=C4LXI2_ENTH1|nr:hypothetical protein, conserved [Entamoeba histolytica HM-1:IMSS]EMD43147.1 Hypothetical protein EHI5A_013970 [Entamoeba histolytica KU27]EMH73042.1 hypothetical protein EHI8A_002200 [Entamoeba histolytica HM-1:IMSS-B]EMS15410.1 hypothetical protein KM1_014630 [Entamoeba histolytica HM-3:IMSS]ENY60751.1 hypothetical protein EHI7A_003800 [Entamoeba histolytica HM-1:IMSS-A]GAT93461.1 hypothetical protein conserved [Entamoeba histolytica]|eukprot:XP_655526.1 hypothetical protein, conserved [Entamoeba histolytica HM-1:IMSS]